MYVCIMYVLCMYVCMHVCMYICMYVRTYVCMYVCIYVCMYGIMNSFKWHLRRHIQTVWCARKWDVSFWKPLGPFVSLALV